MKKIATIKTDFPSKFGIPRQSGLVPELTGRIIMEPEYRQIEAFRGLEEFSHIWLLWEFSQNNRSSWSATVKPPRLGGKTRMGVFATRAPFRPNPIGLSCVRLEQIREEADLGPVLYVTGADLMDGTTIYDIKPYIPMADSHADATEGFTHNTKDYSLLVEFPAKYQNLLPIEKREAAIGILRQDPRPAYDTDPNRIYGVLFAGFDIHFKVEGSTLRVTRLDKITEAEGN